MSVVPTSSIDSRKSSLSGRKSSLSGRKSSMTGFRPSSVQGRSAVKQDPRPISDQGYRNECIRDVIQYLTTNGYDQTISMKILSSPSSKDFISIISFLFKKLIPNFKFYGKPEDEIPVIVKQIGYPYAISKSTLAAVGSPHTWPSVLAFLQWVVELLMYKEKLDVMPLSAVDFDGQNSGVLSFESIAEYYANFMISEDDSWDKEMAKEANRRVAKLQDEAHAADREIAALQLELEQLNTTYAPVATLKTKRVALTSDREKFIQLVDTTIQYKASNEEKLKEIESQVLAKEADLNEAEVEVKSLRSRVSNQKMSVDDVQRMARERQTNEEQLFTLGKRVKELQRVTWAKESDSGRKLQELTTMAKSFTERARKLPIPQHGLRDYSGKPLTLALQVVGYVPRMPSVFSQDIPSVIMVALSQLRDVAIAQTKKSQDALYNIQAELEKVEENETELKEEKNQLERQLKKLESSHRIEKQKMTQSEESIVKEIEAKEMELEQLRSAMLQAAGGNDDCEGLSKELEAVKSANQAEAKGTEAEIDELMELVTAHKMFVGSIVSAVQAKFQVVADDIERMTQRIKTLDA